MLNVLIALSVNYFGKASLNPMLYYNIINYLNEKESRLSTRWDNDNFYSTNNSFIVTTCIPSYIRVAGNNANIIVLIKDQKQIYTFHVA